MTDPQPTQPSPQTPIAIVDGYLRLLMLPDPVAARPFVAPDLQIRFTGGRLRRDPAECAAFNARAFESNCHVDRSVLRQELIVQMDACNDSAKWLLERGL